MLLRIPKLLNEDQLAAVRAALEAQNAPWVDGRVTAGHQGAAVKRNQQIEEVSPLARELGNVIVSELERNALFISAVLPSKVYPPLFNRYARGNAVRHACGWCGPDDSGHRPEARTDLSATLFLAPPESYEGGELIIETDFGGQNIKSAAGDLVVYTLDVAASRDRRDARRAHRQRVLDSKFDSR